MPLTPRHAAYDILSRWTLLAQPPHLPDRDNPIWENLPPRDRALAFDLISGVIRWRLTLDTVIASQLRQPLDSLDLEVRTILWIAAYQLLFQRSADYAAVNTAVEMARQKAPRAGGLINAVLRGITRLEPRVGHRSSTLQKAAGIPLSFSEQLLFNRPLLPDPQKNLHEYLAAATSHPRPLIAMLQRHHGPHAQNILIHNNLRPALIARIFKTLPSIPGLIQHVDRNFAVATEGWSPQLADAIATGQLSPQDPTAAKTVDTLLQHLPPNATRILDLCAGLGTKSIQLAQALPNVTITATDIDTRKLESLRHRAAQLKLTNIQTTTIEELKPGFDAVLVDAPCSNSGVMNRRVQSRWRWPTLDISALTTLQRKLLRQANTLASVTGIIAYATCSIDPAENASAIDRFLVESKLTLIIQHLTLPAATDDPTCQYDGGYHAILRP